MQEIRSNLVSEVDAALTSAREEALVQARASLTRRFLSGKLTYSEYKAFPKELKKKYRLHYPRPENDEDRNAVKKLKKKRSTKKRQEKAGRKAARK